MNVLIIITCILLCMLFIAFIAMAIAVTVEIKFGLDEYLEDKKNNENLRL